MIKEDVPFNEAEEDFMLAVRKVVVTILPGSFNSKASSIIRINQL